MTNFNKVSKEIGYAENLAMYVSEAKSLEENELINESEFSLEDTVNIKKNLKEKVDEVSLFINQNLRILKSDESDKIHYDELLASVTEMLEERKEDTFKNLTEVTGLMCNPTYNNDVLIAGYEELRPEWKVEREETLKKARFKYHDFITHAYVLMYTFMYSSSVFKVCPKNGIDKNELLDMKNKIYNCYHERIKSLLDIIKVFQGLGYEDETIEELSIYYSVVLKIAIITHKIVLYLDNITYIK